MTQRLVGASYTAAAAACSAAIVYLLLAHPDVGMLLAACLGLALVGTFVHGSMARIGGSAVVGVIAIQLVVLPEAGLTAATLAGAVTLAGLAVVAIRLALARGVPLGAALWLSVPFAGLGVFDTLASSMPTTQVLFALQLAAMLLLGYVVGRGSTPDESRTLLRLLTVVAVAASAIAVYEAATGKPLYEFTSFQTQSSDASVFRASAFFGHPLILASFNAAVAIANFASMRVTRWSGRRLLTSVALPLVGAVLAQSRSVVVMLALGVAAIIIWRSRAARSGLRRIGAIALIAVLGGALYVYVRHDSALLQRFNALSLEEQQVRASGLSNVLRLTNGAANVVGNGPKSVASALTGGDSRLVLGTVDNQFLTAFADYGILGLSVLAIATFSLVRAVWSSRVAVEAAAPVCAAVTLLGSMFFLDALYWPAIGLLFAVGCGAAHRRIPSEAAATTPMGAEAGEAPVARAA